MSGAHKFWRFSVQENNGADTVVFSNQTFSAYPFGIDFTITANGLWRTVTHQGLDGNVTQRIWTGQLPSENTQISYEFTTPLEVGAYSLTANGATAPKSWRVEYSDDGVFWHVAHIEYAQRDWHGETRQFLIEQYELNLNVQGSNAAPSFFAFIHDLNGELILKQRVWNGETSILMPSAKPVAVTVVQEYGSSWQNSIYYPSGALVFPTDPITTPYYFRNRRAGISGQTEPAWQLNPENLTFDGSCVFELVERFNAPITHAPLIPVRKL